MLHMLAPVFPQQDRENALISWHENRKGGPMFEELNTIPWHELTHAYGSAEEVPMWLRQLASNEESIREQAMSYLTSAICHQGWISPATGYAVPYLLELLQIPTVQGKAAILDLLADIAKASPELREEQWRKNPNVPQWNVPDYISFKNAQLEVSKGLPLFQTLLTHEDEEIRMNAVQLFSAFASPTQEHRDLLLATFQQEPVLLVRANLVLALGVLSHDTPAEWTFFEDQLAFEPENLLTLSAAVSLAHLRKQHTPDRAEQVLVRALFDRPEIWEPYRSLPCGDGAAWLSAGRALVHLGAERLQYLVSPFLSLFKRADKWERYFLADLLLAMFFAAIPPAFQKQQTRADLTEIQWNVLNMLADQKDIWGVGNLQYRLRTSGLPDSYPALLTFLGREVPSRARNSFPQSMHPKIVPPSKGILDIFRETLRSRYPELKSHHYKSTSAHNLITVNEKWMFRVPRNQGEVGAMKRELALLRFLQGRVPLPIPDPLYVSEDAREFGRTFMGYARLPGKPLYKEMLESIEEEVAQGLIEQIVFFLAALHQIPLEDLASLTLPIRHSRHWYNALYNRVREVLFPQMPRKAREQSTAYFETFLETTDNFALPLTLVHGAFGPAHILYHARDRTLGGIVDFDEAGLGDPASDFGRLLGQQGYGLEAFQRCAQVYPGLSAVLERAQFYIYVSSMQDALSKMKR